MNNQKTDHVEIWLSGIVQGVSFRVSTKARADELGLAGYVRNLPDGRVEIAAEGAREQLEDLIDFVRTGPADARVDFIKVRWRPAMNQYHDFQILT